MPITKSAKKALRASKRKRKHNLLIKEKMKTLIKEMDGKIQEKKIDEIKKLLPQVSKVVDKAAKGGVIKKNTASRKKSRLAKRVNKLTTKS